MFKFKFLKNSSINEARDGNETLREKNSHSLLLRWTVVKIIVRARWGGAFLES